MDDDERWQQEKSVTRIVVRPIGNPLPLGFLGLAVATLVYAAMELGWIPRSEQHSVALVLIAFTFPVQALAAVFGFLGRDPVGGTGLGVLSGGWLTIGLLTLGSPPGARSQTLAFLLFVGAAALVAPVVASATAKLMPALVMGLTAARWVLTGVWERTGVHAWRTAGAWEGVALCVVALYAALAFEVEGALRRTVLPVGRHGMGRTALTGGLRAEIARIEHEPGVREQL